MKKKIISKNCTHPVYHCTDGIDTIDVSRSSMKDLRNAKIINVNIIRKSKAYEYGRVKKRVL